MMGNTFYFGWEVELMEWIQSWAGPAWVRVFSFLTMFGEQLLMIAVMGFLYWGVDKKAGRRLGLYIITITVWNPLVKNIFLRRRPYFDHPGIRCLHPVSKEADIYDIAAQGYSFPSGHSSDAMGLFGGLARCKKARWSVTLAVIMPLLVGISRIALGVHYPTDVLAGWALGALAVAVIELLDDRIRDKRLLYLLLALIGSTGWFYCDSNDFYTGYGMMLGVMAGLLFEEKYVRFQNTDSAVRRVLRLAGGVALYFGLNALLKLPFPASVLDAGDFTAHLIRASRYTVITFVMAGAYPMLFAVTARVGRKKT